MLIKFQAIEIKQVSENYPLGSRKKGGSKNDG
jgi:hypothetical protein